MRSFHYIMLYYPYFFEGYIDKFHHKNVCVSLSHISNVHRIQMSTIIQEIYRQIHPLVCSFVPHRIDMSNEFNCSQYIQDI